MTQPVVGTQPLPPANPYGTDMAIVSQNGVLDLLPTMSEVSGLGVYVQSIIMRQTTPTGSCIQAPNDCFDVRGWVSKGATLAQINQLGPSVAAELLKDQRTKSATVVATFDLSTSTLTLVESIDSTLGPFTLTLKLTKDSIGFILSQYGT